MAYDWMYDQYYASENYKDSGQQYVQPYRDMIDASLCYLIYLEDTPVGVCLMGRDKSGYMTRIFVAKSHRGNGLAKYAIDYLKVKSLACLKDNIVALELYKSLGFTVKCEHQYVVDLVRNSN